MNRPGWVKLYNQTLDSDFWSDNDEPFDWRSAFLHVLISANWRSGISRKCGHTIVIERGQWLTSIRKMMATFRWSRKRVENWIDGMKKYGMLESKSVGFGTVLTVVNYDKYQNDGAKVEHTQGHTAEHTEKHTQGHTEEPRSKTTDIRQQTEDNISARAGKPQEALPEPEPGTPEWYAAHYDD